MPEPHLSKRLTTRAEWPYLVLPVLAVLVVWYAANVRQGLYPPDLSEGGRFHLITYGTDHNPARAEQMGIFNPQERRHGLKVVLVPGGNGYEVIPTASAGGNAADILDVYNPEDFRLYVDKGIALPLNEHLKRRGLDPAAITWPSRLEEIRRPNPAWKPGDHALDRFIYYAVPNNMNVPMVHFNRSLYRTAAAEARDRGLAVPPEPWLHWTWWDYAALGRIMHRRSASGRFDSFGADPPRPTMLYRQICAGRLTPEPDQSYGENISPYRRQDGDWRLFPDREALAEAMQYAYDVVHTFSAAPSDSEADQMATSGMGGFGISGSQGRFKAGVQGLLIEGRWFIGQTRAHAAFDWMLLRLPRWVPYAEWARWQREGRGPGQRDGAWGDAPDTLGQAPASAWRGYANTLGGRLSFISSSCRHPKRAAAFIAFLLTNEAFNRTLLTEDGFGASVAITREALAKPDPLYPDEGRHRPVEHELDALERLGPEPAWPWDNLNTGYWPAEDAIANDIASLTGRTLPGRPLPYAEMLTFGPLTTSGDGIGPALASSFIARLEAAADDGRAARRPPRAEAPSWACLAFLLGVALATGFGIRAWRRKVKP